MGKYPKGGLIGKAADVILEMKEKQIPLHAAYAGYFIVLSVFPALLMLLSILRYTGIQVENLIDLLRDFLPQALMDTAEELVYSTYFNSSGRVLGLSALTALWSASRGVYGVLRGLNAVYDVWENRGYLYTRGISVIYTFLLGLVLLLTLVLHVFGNTILNWLTMVDNAMVIFLMDLVDLRFFLLLILQSLIFTLMFMVLPNQRNRFLDSLPGGILSSIGWLVFSDIFSIYVENFNSYANIYGSVYAVALCLLWLYCCLSILFYGGALNHYLSKRS
ncbi:MAG: YihY/virulence factor BrkB family protein [Faecousia sp.]